MRQETRRGAYPRLTIDLGLVERNTRAVAALAGARGMALTGVVKGLGGHVRTAAAMARGGCASLASSRLEQLEGLRRAMEELGPEGCPALPLGLLRVPAPSELAAVARLADWSLASDGEALRLLNERVLEARREARPHGVVLMLDVGDLREGWFDDDELLAEALRVERELPGLRLRGIGTNVGCYGSVLPTPVNLGRLVDLARRIEDALGRRLEVVSGGATSSLPLLASGAMPAGITELRVGEAILCARDLPEYYRAPLPGVQPGVVTLEAEVIEMRRKPSVPVGERFIDAFGRRPEYEDRGERLRLLLAVGKRDVGDPSFLSPRDPRVHVIGGSSDHLICEVDEPAGDLRYGSVLAFDLFYGAMLFLSDADPYVGVVES